jgi:uncharacterized protein YndB with AHSA1/START domain
MPPKAQALAETAVIVDRDARTIILTRTFTTPREQVFEAWTRPQHVACWWDPSGARLAECEIDLRPGGAFKFVNRGSHGIPPFSGIYREIVPPEQLIFEAMGAIGKVLLKDVGSKTLMTVSIECGSTAHLDQFLQMGVDVGTSQTLDNLVAYLSAKRQ